MESDNPQVRGPRPYRAARVAAWSVVVSVVCFGLAAVGQPAASLVDAVDKALLPSREKQVDAAVVLLDLQTGRTLYASTNADAALMPASNLKLLTSAAALDRFGAGFPLTTTLAIAGSDLLIIGGGDPALGDSVLAERRGEPRTAVFDHWAAVLRQAGLTRFAGDVVVVDPVFDMQTTHPTWGDYNRLQWYGAPIAGLNYNTNCVDFTFLPAAGGGNAIIQTDPQSGGFEIQGTVKTVSSVKQHKPILGKRPQPVDGRSVYPVGGAVARLAGPYSKPVDDPLQFTGQVFKDELGRRGISVNGSVLVTHHLPTGRYRAVATYQTPLGDVVDRVNTNSQNMMAEALAKLNGLAYLQDQGVADARGSWGAGHLAVVAMLKRLGIDSLPVVCADGSGLSRENRVSVRVLAELIQKMVSGHPQGGAYLGSLAVAGQSGSLGRRLDDLDGRVFAKTGTINGVSSLSGLVIDEFGRGVVFSVIHNGIKGGSSPYRRQQDEVVRAAAAWLDQLDAPGPYAPEVPAAVGQVLQAVSAE